MILHKEWGKHVRLGNYMFKYASLIGISQKYGKELCLPNHYMFDYFHLKPKYDDNYNFDYEIYDPSIKYNPSYIDENLKTDKTVNCTVGTFLQTSKYWKGFEDVVHSYLKFDETIVEIVREKYKEVLSKKTIGISIRRGDFVGHHQFEQIPNSFYLYSIKKYFPDWKDYNLLFFCDDSGWIRSTFKGDNVFYADGNFTGNEYWNNPMEQLILASLCDNFIISNSTFSWWMAYYSVNINNPLGKVIHSGKNLRNLPAVVEYDVNDYYDDGWILSDFYEQETLNLEEISQIYYGN